MQLLKKYPVLFMLFGNMMLATNSVMAKIATESLPPLFYGGARYVLMGSVFLAWAIQYKSLFKKEAMPKLAFDSLLQVGFAASWFIGLQYTQAINASIIFLLTPIVVYVGSVMFLKEPRSNRALAGSLIALVGGLVLFGAPAIDSSNPNQLLGNGLVLLASILLGTIILHTKSLYSIASRNVILGTRFFFAGIALVLSSLALEDLSTVFGASMTQWLAFAFSVTFAGIFGFVFFYGALKYIRAEDSSSLFYVDPLVGALAATVLLGEMLSPSTFIASLIIVTGVLISHPVHINRLMFYHNEVHISFNDFLLFVQKRYKTVEMTARRFF